MGSEIWRMQGINAATERAINDYYCTSPKAIDLLKEYNLLLPGGYWECACGAGYLSKRLEEMGYTVLSTDLIDRGFGEGGRDFLLETKMPDGMDYILTNPPFSLANEFIEHAHALDAKRIFLFLKLGFLEGLKRKRLFDKYPPHFVCVFVKRIACGKDDIEGWQLKSSAMAFAWYIWDRDYTGDTIIRWLE